MFARLQEDFESTLAKAMLAVATILSCATPAWSQPIPGSLPAQWTIGASDCAASPQAPLQVYSYEPQTFILRQSPCVDPEANFLYLLVGSQKALLIDTGAVADPAKMPLAQTILSLLPLKNGVRLPLLIVHTHRHRDHYAGDIQFASAPDVQIVAPDLAAVRAFFQFDHWPEGVAHLDIGDRMVDVIPTPGHEAAHIAFYDERTALLLSGVLAGRPLAHILGGHIERDAAGRTYAQGSTYHPNERALELSRQDLLTLPVALSTFNGFYASHENYSITHPMHNLLLLLFAVFALVAMIVFACRAIAAWGIAWILELGNWDFTRARSLQHQSL